MPTIADIWKEIKKVDPENHLGLSWPISKTEGEEALTKWQEGQEKSDPPSPPETQKEDEPLGTASGEGEPVKVTAPKEDGPHRRSRRAWRRRRKVE